MKRIILPSLVLLVLGLGIGMTPVLNEYLRWYLENILPISGMIFAILSLCVVYFLMGDLKAPLSLGSVVILTAITVMAYWATYLGTYLTQTVFLAHPKNLSPGYYHVRDLVDFITFMRIQLKDLTLDGDVLTRPLQLGLLGATLTFSVDCLLCGIIFFFSLRSYAAMFPFCGYCRRHKNLATEKDFYMGMEPLGLNESVSQFKQLVEKENVRAFNSLWKGMDQGDPTASTFKLRMKEYKCPTCLETTVEGKGLRKNIIGSWTSVPGTSFHLESPPN